MPPNTDQSLILQSNDPVIASLDTFVNDIFFFKAFDWLGLKSTKDVTISPCPENVLTLLWCSILQTLTVVSALKKKQMTIYMKWMGKKQIILIKK